ncbi:MAG TPA: hypothetical protein VF772_02595, partial [Terriglobales bacterium]
MNRLSAKRLADRYRRSVSNLVDELSRHSLRKPAPVGFCKRYSKCGAEELPLLPHSPTAWPAFTFWPCFHLDAV